MRKYFDYLYELALSQTAKSTYLTTFGAGLNAFLGFIFWIIVARLLSPSDFGLFSVVFNLVTVLLVFCDFGFSSSILRFLPRLLRNNQEEKATQIVKIAFFIILGTSSFLALFLVIFSKPISVFLFAKKELFLPILISSFSLIGLSLSYFLAAVFQGRQKFLLGVITENSIGFFKVLALIFLLFVGKFSLFAVLVIFSTASFFGLFVSLFFLSLKTFFVKTDFAMAKTLLSFGSWVALSRVLNSISARIDVLMLVRFMEAAEVGFYAAAQRMTFVFPLLIGGISVVLSPKFASFKTLSEAKTFMKKSIFLVSLVFLPVILLFILAPWMTILVYGQSYEPSIYIFRWLLLSSSFFIASAVPVTVIIYFLGNSKFFALLSLGQLILIFLGNLVLIPKFGAVGPAISLAFSHFWVFLVSSIFVFWRFRKIK